MLHYENPHRESQSHDRLHRCHMMHQDMQTHFQIRHIDHLIRLRSLVSRMRLRCIYFLFALLFDALPARVQGR